MDDDVVRRSRRVESDGAPRAMQGDGRCRSGATRPHRGVASEGRPPELLRRVYDCVRVIEASGAAVETAVLCCNDEANVRALEGRVPLARALLATILRNGNGRLELVARAAAKERVKDSVMALAGTLTEALAATTASVSARFLDT